MPCGVSVFCFPLPNPTEFFLFYLLKLLATLTFACYNKLWSPK